jgi:hypothetical protein
LICAYSIGPGAARAAATAAKRVPVGELICRTAAAEALTILSSASTIRARGRLIAEVTISTAAARRTVAPLQNLRAYAIAV